MEKNKGKSKSIVVKFETWNKMQTHLYHRGIRSMDELISRMIESYEKEVK